MIEENERDVQVRVSLEEKIRRYALRTAISRIRSATGGEKEVLWNLLHHPDSTLKVLVTLVLASGATPNTSDGDLQATIQSVIDALAVKL